jgi:hypothetical protein
MAHILDPNELKSTNKLILVLTQRIQEGAEKLGAQVAVSDFLTEADSGEKTLGVTTEDADRIFQIRIVYTYLDPHMAYATPDMAKVKLDGVDNALFQCAVKSHTYDGITLGNIESVIPKILRAIAKRLDVLKQAKKDREDLQRQQERDRQRREANKVRMEAFAEKHGLRIWGAEEAVLPGRMGRLIRTSGVDTFDINLAGVTEETAEAIVALVKAEREKEKASV